MCPYGFLMYPYGFLLYPYDVGVGVWEQIFRLITYLSGIFHRIKRPSVRWSLSIFLNRVFCFIQWMVVGRAGLCQSHAASLVAKEEKFFRGVAPIPLQRMVDHPAQEPREWYKRVQRIPVQVSLYFCSALFLVCVHSSVRILADTILNLTSVWRLRKCLLFIGLFLLSISFFQLTVAYCSLSFHIYTVKP